jgi:hypothetical protein
VKKVKSVLIAPTRPRMGALLNPKLEREGYPLLRNAKSLGSNLSLMKSILMAIEIYPVHKYEFRKPHHIFLYYEGHLFLLSFAKNSIGFCIDSEHPFVICSIYRRADRQSHLGVDRLPV